MMIQPKLDIFEHIDALFEQFQDNYLIYQSYLINDPKGFERLKNEWPIPEPDNPAEKLTDILIKQLSEFRGDIRFNIMYDFRGAIEYAKTVIAKQYRFIKLNFESTLIEFSTINFSPDELYLNTDEQRKNITNENFLKMIQLEIIDFLSIVEMEFALQCPYYEPLLLKKGQITKTLKIPDRIRLDYGYNDAKVIVDLHKFLNGTYIEAIDLESFKKHFTENSSRPKLKWKETDILILLLFRGKQLDPFFKIEEYIVLKIKGNAFGTICDHFLNKKNEPFDRPKITRNMSSLKSSTIGQNASQLIYFITDLNRKYAPDALPVAPKKGEKQF